MKKLLKTCIFILFSSGLFSQENQVKGLVVDSETGEEQSGIHIQLKNTKDKNLLLAVTNLKGEFSFNKLGQGEFILTASSVGYINYTDTIQLESVYNTTINLQREVVNLGEAIVISSLKNRVVKQIPLPLVVIDKNQMLQSSAITISDVIGKEAGVALSRDGAWATGINIRGLGEKRLVMLVDGNRIENATDLMASMSFFNPDNVERIEIIKGASSSIYGTGAMGGIVNIITHSASFNSKPYFNGNFNTGYSTVNNLLTSSLSVNTGSDKWYFGISGSFRQAENMNTPEGIIDNSQFNDKSISASLAYKINKNQTTSLKYQYFDADNVGIPGGAVFPGPAKATYTDAKRSLLSLNHEIKNISDRLSLLNIKYFHQSILREVELEPNISTTTANSVTKPELFTPVGEHITDGIQLQTDWSFSQSNNFIVGIDAWRRKLSTSREKNIRVDILNTSGDIVATNQIVRGETPIPESCFGSLGLYLQNEQKILNDKLKLIIGGRIDEIRIANKQAFDYDYLIINGNRNDTPPNQRVIFDENEEYKTSWSANLGLLYTWFKDFDVSLNAGRAFRAPSLEESFKFIDLGNLVRLGDPSLDPEKGYSVDLGLRLWKPKFHFKINGYINWFTDMITEQQGEFIYSYTTGVVDTIPALINTNVDKALLYGVDFNFEYPVYKNILLQGSGSFVRGKDTQNDLDLPLIPPMNGSLGFKYTIPGYGGIEIMATGFADQNKVADGEQKTMGYAIYDLKLYSAVMNLGFTKMQLTGGVENIGDRAYTNHLATNRGLISIEPGRNFYLKLRILF